MDIKCYFSSNWITKPNNFFKIMIRLAKKHLAIFTSSGIRLGKWLSNGDKKCPSKILHSFCSIL